MAETLQNEQKQNSDIGVIDELMNDDSSSGETSIGTEEADKSRMEANKMKDVTNDITIGISSSKQTIREVRKVKIIVVLVLLVSIAGAIAVFFYTKYSEQKEFETQFQDDANKVV